MRLADVVRVAGAARDVIRRREQRVKVIEDGDDARLRLADGELWRAAAWKKLFRKFKHTKLPGFLYVLCM